MAAQDNAALARGIYDLFNQGQLEQAADLAATGVEVVVVPFGQTFQGRDGFMGFMKTFKDAFPDIQITITNQVASEDQVVNECTWTGTHSGPLASPGGEIPPTGKQVAGAQFCEVWRIADGKVARLVNYQDVATWLRQLGLAS
jgi:steroid delta-isomerase-like uncharacterized protein